MRWSVYLGRRGIDAHEFVVEYRITSYDDLVTWCDTNNIEPPRPDDVFGLFRRVTRESRRRRERRTTSKVDTPSTTGKDVQVDPGVTSTADVDERDSSSDVSTHVEPKTSDVDDVEQKPRRGKSRRRRRSQTSTTVDPGDSDAEKHVLPTTVDEPDVVEGT